MLPVSAGAMGKGLGTTYKRNGPFEVFKPIYGGLDIKSRRFVTIEHLARIAPLYG